jgi:hypothetical protein
MYLYDQQYRYPANLANDKIYRLKIWTIQYYLYPGGGAGKAIVKALE